MGAKALLIHPSHQGVCWRHDTEEVLEEPAAANRTGGYFEDFLLDLAGRPNPEGLDTRRVLESSRIALLAQGAADTGEFPVNVGESHRCRIM